MYKFLHTYDHTKLNKEDIKHLNRSITHNEIETAIKRVPKKKSSADDRFSAEFYHIFREELIPTLLKLFYKIEREHTLSNSFYKASITLISKSDRDTTTTKELQANLFNGQMKKSSIK
jgi:hypothetical protein